MDMRSFLAVVGLVIVCGCGAGHRGMRVPPAQAALANGFRRDGHESLSTRDRELIAAARQGISKSGKIPTGASDDAYYRVRRTAEGYELFAIYVTGYDGNKPLFTP